MLKWSVETEDSPIDESRPSAGGLASVPARYPLAPSCPPSRKSRSDAGFAKGTGPPIACWWKAIRG